MEGVRKIVGGMTPKGTIFLREMSEKGQLLRKRVVKGERQYDAKMSDKNIGRCSQVLVTDWEKRGKQTLHLMPKKLGLVKGFIMKLMGADVKRGVDGKFYSKREPIPFAKCSQEDLLYDSYVAMVQDKTGFSNDAINREMADIKTQANMQDIKARISSL